MQKFFSMKSLIFLADKVSIGFTQFKALGFAMYFLCVLSYSTFAQIQTKEHYQSTLKGGTTIGYLSYLPPAYKNSDSEKFPLLIFLHGLGEVGNNLDLVARNGPPLLINQGKWDPELPFVVISPQTSSTFANNWAPFMINNVIDHIVSKYRIDESRIYITGLSLGGHGSWNYTTEYPDRVAAVVPVCGSGNVKRACEMKDVPVWAFHNEGDKTVHVNGTKNMIKALNECSAYPEPKSVIYDKNGHDAWTQTYNLSSGHDIYSWMLSHTNKRATSPNTPPMANAGEDKTLTLPNNSITLEGKGSDNDGSISSYQWVKVNGPNATLTDANKATLKLTNLEEGIYTFKLTVTDNKGATASDQVKVTVNPEPEPENQAPIAYAGEDKILTLPENSVTLEGSGKDDDGAIVSYIWNKISGPSLTIGNNNQSSLNLSNLVVGDYVFELTVTDNKGATASDQVKLTVLPEPEPENEAPTAYAGGDKVLTLPKNYITLEGSGKDNDGSIVSYSWSKVSGPEASIGVVNQANLEVTNLQEGIYVFELIVTDNKGASATALAKVTVNPEPEPENQAPIANAGEDKTLTLPENSIALIGSGEDKDGQIASYSWSKISGPEVILGETSHPTLELAELLEGTYVFELTVTDDKGAKGSSKVKIIVNPDPGPENIGPIADAGSDKVLTLPENSIVLNGAGKDLDGEIVAFEWIKVSGANVTMSDTYNAALTLSDLEEGLYVFKLTVTDDKGAQASDEVQLIVNPELEPENEAPTAYAGGDKVLTLPKNYITLEGSGKDNDGSIVSYRWSKISGPQVTVGDFNEADLELSDLVLGIYVFELTVTDNKGAIASALAKITVNPEPEKENQVPIAYAGEDKTLTLPQNATVLEGSGKDNDGSIVSYSWSKVSGPQVTMGDVNLPELEVSKLLEGIYVFRLVVTDDKGATAYDEIKVTVNPAPNQPPVAIAGKDQLLHLPSNNIKLFGDGKDSDGTIESYHWSKVSGPSVSIMDAYTKTLSLSDMVAGVYTFKLTVTDNRGAKASDEVKITVNSPPQASPGRDKTITLPTSSTYLSGAGSDTDGHIVAYSWTKKSGPDVVMENANTYLLLLSELREGTYTFTLEVTDNHGATATADVKLIVRRAQNILPTVDAGRDKKIQLPVSSLQLIGNASDSDGTIISYQWSQISGPPASMKGVDGEVLELSNLIEGYYTFRLTVRDNDGGTAYDEVNVTIERITANLSLSFNTVDNNCYGANEGAAEVFVTGGEAPYSYYWSNGASSSSIDGLGAGSYTVTVRDKNGVSKKGVITIEQPEELKVAVNITNETNRGNDGKISVNITGGTAPYVYEWSNGGRSSTNDALSNGEYGLIVYDVNGCSTSQSYQVDKYREYNTTIYPNPNNGKFNLSFDNLEATGYQLRVYNSYGQLVFEMDNNITSSVQTESLDLTEMGKGIYYIKIVYDGKYEETKRVIIQ